MAGVYTASVVGGGGGGKLSMNALSTSDRFRLVAAADLREDVCEALKKQFPDIKTFTSHKEMFEQSPTDVVCVSTYAPSHKEITLDALKLPLKGILVEKPLGDTTRAGSEIIEAVRAKKLPMAVPHGLLAAAHSREILRRTHGDEIGRLVLVEIECGKWDIINAGIHWMNFFVMLVEREPIDSVIAMCDTSTRTYRDGMQVETEAVTYVQTKSGVRAVMHTGDEVKTAKEGKGTLFRLVGTEGMIEFAGWESSYRLTNAKHPGGKLIEVERGKPAGHQFHLENMAKQMDSGTPDYAIPESSLAALEICEAAYISHERRCKVVLPLRDFEPPPLTDWAPGQPYSGIGGGRDGRKL